MPTSRRFATKSDSRSLSGSARAGPGVSFARLTEPAPSVDLDKAFEQGPVRATKKAKVRDGKRREKLLDRLRLQGFWPLYAAFCACAFVPPLAEPARPLVALRIAGLALMAFGLFWRVWSLGYLRKKAELCTSGPYGRTRNPLYVGTWLIGCGLALNAAWPANVILLALYNVMFALVYRAQIGIEEEMLVSIFGDVYREYLRRVPRFFPQFRPWTTGDVQTFSFLRALQNRAWEPVLGLCLLLSLQVASWGLLWPWLRGASPEAALRAFAAGGWIGP
jgi:protein-S-isoprenylcysteine O-methyltransferase Ste14